MLLSTSARAIHSAKATKSNMFSGHYYNSTIKKIVAVYGTVFNNISVVRRDPTGKVINVQRVPLAYGPKQKFLARIDEKPDPAGPKIAIKLPRMSFEITGLTYDISTKVNKNNVIDVADPSNPAGRLTVRSFSPYRLGIQLSIMAKNQDDALQVMEQILPNFQPEYTVSVKSLESLGLVDDVPIVLTGVNMTEEYEGDFITRRSIIYTLDFELRIKFYGPASTRGVIKKAIIDFINQDTLIPIERLVDAVEPLTAREEEAHTILQTISLFSDTTSYRLTVNPGTGVFAAGEQVTGLDSATTATIVSIDSETLLVHSANGVFSIGETLQGVTSGTQRTISVIVPTYD